MELFRDNEGENEAEQMSVLNEAYDKAHEVYVKYGEVPANTELKKQFKEVLEEYTGLLKKYNIGIDWVYSNHFELWEHHPVWKKMVAEITKGLKKAQGVEGKIFFLDTAKTTFIKKGKEGLSTIEPPGAMLVQIYINSKIAQLNELKSIENPDKKVLAKLERNISENMSYYETVTDMEKERIGQNLKGTREQDNSNPVIHEHDINTGKIFNSLYIRRVEQEKIFMDAKIFHTITETLKFILSEANIVSQYWKDIPKPERTSYLESEANGTNETYFLLHSTHVVGYSRNEPHSFDLVYYKEPCVLKYTKNDEQSRREFRLFFSLKVAFTDASLLDDFLNYQLAKNFNSDGTLYAKFLDETLTAHKHLISEIGKIDKVKKYIQKCITPEEPIEISSEENFDFPIKAYSPKALQSMYNVTAKTFYSWIKPFKNQIGEVKGKIYTPKQVNVIFSKIGEPPEKK